MVNNKTYTVPLESETKQFICAKWKKIYSENNSLYIVPAYSILLIKHSLVPSCAIFIQ